MSKSSKKFLARKRRKLRVRRKIRGSGSCPRLSVSTTNSGMYLQLIDDTIGHTLVSASHIDKQLRKEISRGSNIEAATKIAELLAKRAKEKGIDEVVFDRGGHLYHGRVKAVAETVRKVGLRC